MNTGLTETGSDRRRIREPAPAPTGAGARGARSPARRTTTTTAILIATAPAAGGEPAGALRLSRETLVGRLCEQLDTLGIRTAHVITRDEWAPAVEAATARAPLAVEIHRSPGLAGDLRAIAAIAGTARGGLVVVAAEVVTHREALAGLLADPRLGTAALVSNGSAGRPFAFRARIQRGRIVSAGSAFHDVHKANTRLLGIFKVAPGDVPVLVDVAQELAALVTAPLPPSWEPALRGRAGIWRLALARAEARARGESAEDVPSHDREAPATAATVPLDAAGEEELDRRVRVAPDDAGALLLVGLVRRGTQVGTSYLRGLFWARPLAAEQVERAERELGEIDEDRILLESAVKANDGFFTTFFVSPYSKYVARWAARRGLTPNQVTTFSLAIGIVAAVLFATGERAGLVAGAVLVHLSFVFDCVDGQLARYTRTFSKLGAWLDSVFDRAKEYVTFAGLAIGAERAGDDVWILAAAALALQSVRHMLEFSFGATRRRLIAELAQPPLEQSPDAEAQRSRAAGPKPDQPAAPPERVGILRRLLRLWRRSDKVPGALWVKKMAAFPIGERFAAIAVTAALFGPRTTFVVLLAWGGFAALYTVSGRLLRSLAG